MIKKFHTLCLLFFIGYSSVGQHQDKTPDPVFGTELGNAGYNVLLGGVIGGIGGMINKTKKQNHLQAFSSNFLKGMVGGFVGFVAKRTLPMIRKDFDSSIAYWMNRALFNVGNSIIFNASLNKKMFETLHLEYYGINIAYHTTLQKAQLRLSLATSLMLFTQVAVFKGNIDLNRTLKYGTFFFYMDENMYILSGGDRTGNKAAGGFAMQNMIYIDPKLNKEQHSETVIHELIHTYQFIDFNNARHFFKPAYDVYIFKKGNFMDRVSKYISFDLPYFFAPYSILQSYDNSTAEYEADFYGNLTKR